jgi:hypothetical protein
MQRLDEVPLDYCLRQRPLAQPRTLHHRSHEDQPVTIKVEYRAILPLTNSAAGLIFDYELRSVSHWISGPTSIARGLVVKALGRGRKRSLGKELPLRLCSDVHRSHVLCSNVLRPHVLQKPTSKSVRYCRASYAEVPGFLDRTEEIRRMFRGHVLLLQPDYNAGSTPEP